MLTFNLKSKWYEKFRSDEKHIEIRCVTKYWTTRVMHLIGGNSAFLKAGTYILIEFENNVPCILRRGYLSTEYMTARIVGIELMPTGIDTDLAVDSPVFAFYLSDIQEKK